MGIWDTSALKDVEFVENSSVETPESDSKVPLKEEPITESPQEWQGLPVRVSGDRIWLLKAGHRHWVTSGEVYQKLGFKFGEERKIDEETLMALPEGEPLR